MIKIYIPGPFSIPIWRQFPDSKRCIWGNCEFYFEEPKEYDYLVVWGLEKELFLPFKEQSMKLEKGRKYLVALYIDKSERNDILKRFENNLVMFLDASLR